MSREEEGKVAADAVYSFDHPPAGLCAVFKGVWDALWVDGVTKEE